MTALRKLYTLHWGDLLILLGVGLMIVGIGIKLEEAKITEKVVIEKAQIQPKEVGIINVNTADIRRLVDLPGIGEKMAQRIIDYRQAYGPFKSKEGIKNVKGIGEKTYEALKNKIII